MPKIGPKLFKNIEDIDTCFDEFVNQSVSRSISFQQISPSLVSSHLRRRGFFFLQGVTEGYKGLQKGKIGLQVVTGSNKVLEEVKRGRKSLNGVTGLQLINFLLNKSKE